MASSQASTAIETTLKRNITTGKDDAEDDDAVIIAKGDLPKCSLKKNNGDSSTSLTLNSSCEDDDGSAEGNPIKVPNENFEVDTTETLEQAIRDAAAVVTPDSARVGNEPTTATTSLYSPKITCPPDEVFEKLFEDTIHVPVQDDLEHLLGDKSQEECHWLLRGMVVDLMQEVDVLKKELQRKNLRIKDIQEEGLMVMRDYRENLFKLMITVGKATQDTKEDRKADYIMANFEDLDAMEATELVIHKLTKKIEQLNIENSRLIACIQEMQSKMEDLESVNEARNLKISALEAQFLNKKRPVAARTGGGRFTGLNRVNVRNNQTNILNDKAVGKKEGSQPVLQDKNKVTPVIVRA